MGCVLWLPPFKVSRSVVLLESVQLIPSRLLHNYSMTSYHRHAYMIQPRGLPLPEKHNHYQIPFWEVRQLIGVWNKSMIAFFTQIEFLFRWVYDAVLKQKQVHRHNVIASQTMEIWKWVTCHFLNRMWCFILCSVGWR